MQPYYVDLAFLGVTLVLFITGWRRGFVRMAGGLVSLAVSIVAGLWGVRFLEDAFGIPLSSSILGLLFAFLLIAVLVSALLHLVISLLDLVRRLLTIIPGIGFLHRFAGAIVGLVEAGALLLAVSYLAMYMLAAGDARTTLLASESVTWGVRALLGMGF